ncbi:hypothetical protein POVWA2_006530 [Plasmodium ovale wallikeri]|uniref:Uncharacterized protein n=1 Tax=Plasmodium ovale wallikeri TaxID=864142 RepID=A0A1A8YI98_PLAOA|nr:hypothetical protein POVWA1_006300 [Plasmodium ovale wallikeri]SBT31871.1 hypothetical protein POVWA2_006530 [Plasmodium ovale wallikeri]
MEPIKILYLHIYEDSKTKKIRSLLEEIYGKDNVISSKDKSRTIDILILIFVYTLCLCCILLISPVQENFFSARVRKEVPIADFPYIIFVHSTLDRKRNLNKTLQLVESLGKEKYRVEIINEGYNLELLNKSDYKNWIDEVYAQSIQHMTTRSKSETTIDEDMFKPDE